jgi:plasmid stabilization system protein ParE
MTKPEVILTPQAREDIKQIAAYIKEDSPQSSLAFRQTLENIYEALLERGMRNRTCHLALGVL